MRNLLSRPWRFNELKQNSERIIQKVLTDSLRSMEAVGIKNICAKCLRTNNPQNVVKATMVGLTSLRSPEQVAAIRGKSVEEIVG